MTTPAEQRTPDGKRTTKVEIDLTRSAVSGPFLFDVPDSDILVATSSDPVLERDLGSVGRCIYCGTHQGPLSKEHIIPYGLGGVWVLRNASCATCSDRTSKFEHEVMRKAGHLFRAALGFPTRHQDARPSSETYTVTREGVASQVDLPFAEYVPMLGLPRFRPPAILAGEHREEVAIYSIASLQPLISGVRYKTLEELGRGLGASNISRSQLPFDPTAIARLAAKVALGWCVSQLGIDAFEHIYVRIPILEARDIGTWIGGPPEARFAEAEPHDHIVSLDIHDREVHSTVKLLARWGAPEYLVVVGRLRPDWAPREPLTGQDWMPATQRPASKRPSQRR